MNRILRPRILGLGLLALALAACGGHEKVQAVDRLDVAAERAKAAFPEAEKITFDDEGAAAAPDTTAATTDAATADAAATDAQASATAEATVADSAAAQTATATDATTTDTATASADTATATTTSN